MKSGSKTKKLRDIEAQHYVRKLVKRQYHLRKQKPKPKETQISRIPLKITYRVLLGSLIAITCILIFFTMEHIARISGYIQEIPGGQDDFIDDQPGLEQKCRFPQLSLYTPEIIRVMAAKKPDKDVCQTKVPLLFDNDFDNNLLMLDEPSKYGFRNCCFSQMVRSKLYGDKIAEYEK